ncbi:MAG: hypothetical protein ACRD1S_12145, partial [Vicinamibacterales bacterium]
MTIAQNSERTPRKPLRLWPGVVAVVLLFLARFGLKAVVPGFRGFALGMQGALIAAVAVVVWWVFLSRAAWSERLGAIVLMTGALGGSWLLRHESMGPFWLFAYAIPILCLALVTWAVASRRLADRPRRATMVATVVLACGVWTLVRTEGISGDHVATFAWRWAASPEERLLAPAADQPTSLPPPSASTAKERLPAEASDKPLDSARGGPTAPALPPAATKAGADSPAMSERGLTRVEWPGFRGPERDGIIRGMRIETDWSRLPPIELWRRSIGPGWSSFAVQGDLLYTQEQRGDDELVVSYKVTT